MSSPWQYQLRIGLAGGLAEIARRDPHDPTLGPLVGILKNHKATIKSQYDAFADYVAEAEREGVEAYPLYGWTKATIADPVKQAKYVSSFAIYLEGREVYGEDEADALERELQPLIAANLITRLTRHDTNPANSLQVPARYRSRTVT
jgi:hypothetical protein